MSDAHAEDHGHSHPYHLVDPSPWPLVGSIAGGLAALGMVLFMHDMGVWLLPIGMIAIAFVMVVWWRDVIKEATHQGHHTPIVQLGLRYGMALFIASEVMFFVAWFWAYFDAWLFPKAATGYQWPPIGVEVFEPFGLPFLNTLILLLSGCTVTWAHHALREGDRRNTLIGLALTILLGAAFTALQAFEYSHAGFSFAWEEGNEPGQGGIYSSTFFMATGFHGAHVIIGTLFLIVCFFRAYLGHFKPDHHFGFEAAAWYWHFVDVVWLFLFIFVYFASI